MKNQLLYIVSKLEWLNLSYVLFSLLIICSQPVLTQTPSCDYSGPLVKWTFNKGEAVNCNGAVGIKPNGAAQLKQDINKYCPNFNAGCGKALLGSKGHTNTGFFANGICNSDFYLDYSGLGTSSTWNPLHPKMIRVVYEIPAGSVTCLTSFSVDIMGKPEKMLGFGIAAYKNGVKLGEQLYPSTVGNKTMTFTGPDYCSDGSAPTTFTIYYGYWGSIDKSFKYTMGADNITLNGSCVKAPPSASAIAATCAKTGPLSNGKLKLSGFSPTDQFQYALGSTFDTMVALPSVPTLIPASGILVENLPPAPSPQDYTIQVTNASGCKSLVTVSMLPTICTDGCSQPQNIVLTPIEASCNGSIANSDAQISVSGVLLGDRVALSAGNTYTGIATYNNGADTLNAGNFIFQGLPNPVGDQTYTVRVYNSSNHCFVDKLVVLPEALCGPCRKTTLEVMAQDNKDPNSTPANGIVTEDDFKLLESCKDDKFIDLSLTKTVSPISGLAGITDFVWTINLKNEGTMTATNIQVADLIPNQLTLISSVPTAPTFTDAVGWLIDTLHAGADTTLLLYTKALMPGVITNCAEVNDIKIKNDPDSSPGNLSTNEDDDDCATITVTGNKLPTIEKEFSPWVVKPNTPFNLTLKITNNESVPIFLTQPLVDSLPALPAQMTIAPSPALVTSFGLSGIVANPGSNVIVVPVGTTLLPGANLIQVNVVAPDTGTYCNHILPGDLKTTRGDNAVGATACIAVQLNVCQEPVLSVSFNPNVISILDTAILTIQISNPNPTTMTLEQEYVNILPHNTFLAGNMNMGTCAGVNSLMIGDTTVRMANGTVIGSGTCTIIVPVVCTGPGSFISEIYHNDLLVTACGGTPNIGNRGLSQAGLQVLTQPCNAISNVSIAPIAAQAYPGQMVSFTSTSTGADSLTLFSWTALPGTSNFNPQTATTTFTAPSTPGDYTIQLVLDNTLSGYGTCKDSVSTTFRVNALPTGSIGNFIWKDLNNNGSQDSGEPGIEHVEVQLFRNNILVALDTTDISGNYLFEGLDSASYFVKLNPSSFPVGCALSLLPNASGVADSLDSDFDPITYQTSPVVLDPSNPLGGLLLSNLTLDAAFYSPCSISVTSAIASACNSATNTYSLDVVVTYANSPSGNINVHTSNGDSISVAKTTSPQTITLAGLTSNGVQDIDVVATFASSGTCIDTLLAAYDAPASCEKVALGNLVFMDNNSDGTFQSGTDMALDNVLVWLFAAGDNPATATPVATNTTLGGGFYLFDQLNPGQYFVHIPASNFTPGQPLQDKISALPETGDDNVDDNDNGQNTLVSGGVSSGLIDLQPNTEPTLEMGAGAYTGLLDDNNVNMTVDFGFNCLVPDLNVSPASVTVCSPFSIDLATAYTVTDVNNTSAAPGYPKYYSTASDAANDADPLPSSIVTMPGNYWVRKNTIAGCWDTVRMVINAITPPDAGADGNTTVCDNSTTPIDLFGLITGEQAGGTWTRTSGTGGSFDALAGTFTPAVEALTSTFTYTVTGTVPCPNDQSIATINISASAGGAMIDQNAPTCTSSTPNNNGSATLTAVDNATRFGISTLGAGSYDGPAFAGATTLSLPQTLVTGVPNTGGTYLVRLFTTADCYEDVPMTFATVTCTCPTGNCGTATIQKN